MSNHHLWNSNNNNNRIDKIKRSQALKILNEAITTLLDDEYEFKIVCVGSYGLDTYDENSDINLVLACSMYRSRFAELIELSLSCQKPDCIKVIKIMNNNFTKPLTCTIIIDNEYIVKIQYLEASMSLLRRKNVNLSQANSDLLNIIKDCNLSTFKQMVRIVVYWAKQRQVYGHQYGFVGHYGFAIMCARICYLNPESNLDDLILKFFIEYTHWDYTHCPITIQNKIVGNVNPREIFAIMTPTKHCKNVIRNATKTSLRIFKNELRRALDLLVRLGPGFENTITASIEMKHQHKAFVRISVNTLSFRDFVHIKQQCETNLYVLIRSLERSCPSVNSRLYTCQYFQNESNYPYNMSMYIGLTLQDQIDTNTNQLQTQLHRSCQSFYKFMCQELEFSMYDDFTTTLLKSSDICEYNIILPSLAKMVSYSQYILKQASKGIANKVAKLTPAHQIMNRLEHDARFDSRDFIVMYEDRFIKDRLAAKPASLFKVDISSDDFIPFHRIFQFKIGDTIVWDRKAKIDSFQFI